jgi:hypothetical protein
MTPLKPTDKYLMSMDINQALASKQATKHSETKYRLINRYTSNGFNLCYYLEDCISIIPDFLFYQIKSVNIRDIKKHTEIPKPIHDYLNNNIHILEEIKEIYLMNMLE